MQSTSKQTCVALVAMTLLMICIPVSTAKSEKDYFNPMPLSVEDASIYGVINETAEGATTVNEVRKLIEMLKTESGDVSILDISTELSDLADVNRPCNGNSILYYTDFVQWLLGVNNFGRFVELVEVNQKPIQNSVIFDYLKAVGAEKFPVCFKKQIADYNRTIRREQAKAELVLDEVIQAATDHSSKTDADLYEKASQLDFINGSYKSNALIKLAKKEIERNYRADAIEHFGNFFMQYCAKLLNPLKLYLSIYNFTRLFKPDVVEKFDRDPSSIKLKKINEYSRLCYQFQNPKKRVASLTKMRDNRSILG